MKGLIRHAHINDEQYNQLVGMIDDLDINKVISIIKLVKDGRDEDFLPRETKQLHLKLQEWGNMHEEEATPDLKKKMFAALYELLFRKAISKQDFKSIMESL